MKRVNWLRGATTFLLTAILLAGAASALPDDEYQRYETLEKTIQNRIRWIYERVHDDPAPVDVAVIGSSRFGAGISGPGLEAGLRALGRDATTVNFSLPENGRNLNWVILDQLLRTKSPKLLVIGVIEKPGRYGHPAYKYVAPASAVVDPGYAGNLTYLGNLAYLPYRQLRLFAARVFPDLFGLPLRFDPARYPGRNLETTGTTRTGDGILLDRDRLVPRAHLDALVRTYEKGVNPPLLGSRFADVEFGDERTYVRRMVGLARAKNVRVVFLFMTYFTGPDAIQERAFYERYGPIIDASWVAAHPDFFSDAVHLNTHGAQALTAWLAPRLAPYLPADDGARPSPG